MATEIVWTVKPGGTPGTDCDYNTLNAWESGEQRDIRTSNADVRVFHGTLSNTISAGANLLLYRGGVYQSAICVAKKAASSSLLYVYSMNPAAEGYSYASGDEWRVSGAETNKFTLNATTPDWPIIVAECLNGEDTTSTTIAGWDLEAGQYLEIRGAASDKTASNTGKWSTERYRLSVSAATGIINNEDYVRIRDLQVLVTASSGGCNGISNGTLTSADNEVHISVCIVRAAFSGTAQGIGIYSSSANNIVYVYNNIIYDFNFNAVNDYSIYIVGTGYVYFNTVAYCYNGIRSVTSGGVKAIGNLVTNITTASSTYVGTFATGTDYNSTDSTDAIGQGSNNKTSISLVNLYVDPTASPRDLHIQSGATSDVKDRFPVADPPSGVFTDDIDGQTRDSTWDIGADEYLAAGGYTITAATGSFTETGNAGGLLADRLVSGAQGSFTLTGNAAATLYGRKLAASTGAFSESGNAADVLFNRLVAALKAEFALTGIDATLTYTPAGAYSLTADKGSFTLTGNAAGLLAGWLLAAAQGQFAFTGNAADLTYTPTGAYILPANTGSYILTGNAAALLAARKLVAELATYSETGNAAGLLHGYLIAASAGAFAESGIDADWQYLRVLAALRAEYALTGNAAVLTYSGSGDYHLTAALGEFTLTGNAASFKAWLASLGFTACTPAAIYGADDRPSSLYGADDRPVTLRRVH